MMPSLMQTPEHHRKQLLAHLASQWAASIANAERPAPFSYRDGSVLRLVPANERLPAPEIEVHLTQLLEEQQHLLDAFQDNVQSVSAKGKKVPRHLAAWARGCCYLHAANTRQALRDAKTALAYATANQPSTVTTAAAAASAGASQQQQGTAAAASVISTTQATSTDSANTAAAMAADCSTVSLPSCTWVPALLLAAEAYAGHQDWAQAVLHYGAAAEQTQNNTVITGRLAELSVRLPVGQAVAFRTGGLRGLLQQLQLEDEMKMPEILRPRPKWYYYNKWMTQRIHTALLEYHLGCSLGSGTSQQQLEAAEAMADEPAVAAAAAAAGFWTRSSSSSPAGAVQPGHALSLSEFNAGHSDQQGHGYSEITACQQHQLIPLQQQLVQGQQQQQQQGVLRLPESVVAKLLAMDAGDLDLMIQHPQALQAQVYELLDVLELSGPQGLASHPVPHLTWEEVQVLTAPDTVGLPLGYKPSAATAPKSAAKALPGIHEKPAAATLQAGAELLQAGGAVQSVSGEVVLRDTLNAAGAMGWRQHGFSRSQYLLGRNDQAI